MTAQSRRPQPAILVSRALDRRRRAERGGGGGRAPPATGRPCMRACRSAALSHVHIATAFLRALPPPLGRRLLFLAVIFAVCHIVSRDVSPRPYLAPSPAALRQAFIFYLLSVTQAGGRLLPASSGLRPACHPTRAVGFAARAAAASPLAPRLGAWAAVRGGGCWSRTRRAADSAVPAQLVVVFPTRMHGLGAQVTPPRRQAPSPCTRQARGEGQEGRGWRGRPSGHGTGAAWVPERHR